MSGPIQAPDHSPADSSTMAHALALAAWRSLSLVLRRSSRAATTENAPPGRRGDFWGYYREKRTATDRVAKRKVACRAKFHPTGPGCNRLKSCLTVARLWHQGAGKTFRRGPLHVATATLAERSLADGSIGPDPLLPSMSNVEWTTLRPQPLSHPC